MNDFDIQKIISILSKMEKKDLDAGIAKAKEILDSKDFKKE